MQNTRGVHPQLAAEQQNVGVGEEGAGAVLVLKLPRRTDL